MKIKTDNKWKPFKDRYDVPKSTLRDQFDWLDEDTFGGFLKYHGTWYHLGQFLRVSKGSELAGWDGVVSESMTTGVLIQVGPDGEEYRIGAFRS